MPRFRTEINDSMHRLEAANPDPADPGTEIVSGNLQSNVTAPVSGSGPHHRHHRTLGESAGLRDHSRDDEAHWHRK